MKKYKFVIAGGGTGGHLFPGIALAKHIKKTLPESEIIFIGTEKGIENTVVEKEGFELKLIDIAGIKGKGFKEKIKSIFKIPSAINQSLKIIKEFEADAVIGLGGYASGPAVIAAWLGNYPVFIMEQNSIPGITNRILSKFSSKIFTTFTSSHKYFSKTKVVHTGNPVREEIKNITPKKHLKDNFNILVFGGSLGAKKINETLVKTANDLKDIKIVHQTGKLTYDVTKASYNEIKNTNVELTTFIDDMSIAYQNADLVICRAGATSIAEIAIANKASILIPYPFATDNHQVVNAKELVNLGGAIMIEESKLTPELLKEEILKLYENFNQLEQLEENTKLFAKPNSAEMILNTILESI